MTANQMYVRLLTETHHSVGTRSTAVTRMHIQDVLVGLLDLAVAETAAEFGGACSHQDTQDTSEALAGIEAHKLYA